ncbi:hypothetical protein FB446DRAFT_786495 [Lentinula raphanica]|nr:hypothetical protein FB446DRAFT_786495 [Lentinula raphanica]
MSNSLLPPSPTVRRGSTRRRAASNVPPMQDSHHGALQAIRSFLKGRICYDAFPISFRLIVLDTKLSVKRALQCLLMNSVVSAPLWNSDKSEFAGMLTVLDIIHLIQYYWRTSSYDSASEDVETLRLEKLREIEIELGVAQPPLLRKHPDNTLYEAAQVLVQTHARRLPLLDYDSDTGHEVIVSTLTQYRLLKFISINASIYSLCSNTLPIPISSAIRKSKSSIFLFEDSRLAPTLPTPHRMTFLRDKTPIIRLRLPH